MRTLGIDPGTVSFDLCCLDEGGDIVLDQSIASPDLANDPGVLIRAVQACMPFELAAGPSGYGVPLLKGNEIGEREMALMMLVRPDEQGKKVGVGGLSQLIRDLIATGAPLVFTPGVIHLPTVPHHRKANRIDMGTADKVCSVAAAIVDQAQHLQIAYRETSFIMLELGGAFSAAIAVDGGQIVDGMGGSSGPMGFRAGGAMDGELAYLLGAGVTKNTIFSGGALDIAGDEAKSIPFDQWLHHPRLDAAWQAWLESIVKSAFALSASVPHPREVLLSGRMSGLPAVAEEVATRLSPLAPTRNLVGLTNAQGQPLHCKSAAQGAALIANGLADGRYRSLVDGLRLREAHGTALDYLYVRGAAQLRNM